MAIIQKMTGKPAPSTFEKASKNVLRMTGAGLRNMFSDILTEPKKFITLVVLLIVLVLISYYELLLLFLTPVIVFYIALFFGRRMWEERRKKPVGLLGSIFIALLTVLIVTPSIFGYLVTETAQTRTAVLPRGYTDEGSHNGWTVYDDPEWNYDKVEQFGLVRTSMRTYEFYQSDKPPYAGFLVIFTLKSAPATTVPGLQETTRDDTLRQIERILFDLGYEDLVIDKNTKVTGTRTNKEGHSTKYFEYNGKIVSTPSDPRLSDFNAGGKVKVRGEVWICDQTGTVIAVGGLAQYGYTFEAGTFKAGETYAYKEYPDDYRTWTTVKNLLNVVDCH